MTKQPHILITNDDGIHAPGIRHLWNSIRQHAKVTVVAPISEQSAVGLSITIRTPLRIEKVIWESGSHDTWSVTGTPTDCIKLALRAILDQKPDMIISGINRGSNIGRGVLYSGTVAATIESVLQGIPAIAFSCHDYNVEPDYPTLSKYIYPIIQQIIKHPLPKGTLLNVNFPESKLAPFKGVKVTAQGNEWWGEDPDKRIHPSEGHSYYWLGAKLHQDEGEEGESAWLRRGYVTAVPVHVGDLTDRDHMESMKELFESNLEAAITN